MCCRGDDPRDALLSTKAASLAALPKGARIGTASLRRRPDLTILPIHGNVNTRMRKLDSDEIDAQVLAMCGLERLGKAELATEILSREIMLPAVGQGALALEAINHNDQAVRLGVGDVALVDGARPLTVFAENRGEPWNIVTLKLPREALVSHLGFDPQGGLCRRGGTPAGRLLLELIGNSLGG